MWIFVFNVSQKITFFGLLQFYLKFATRMFNIFTDCESPLRMQQNAKSKVKIWSFFKYFEKIYLSEFLIDQKNYHHLLYSQLRPFIAFFKIFQNL